MKKISSILLFLLFVQVQVKAQTDTIRTDDIEIVKEYTPFLEEGKKRSFQPTPPPAQSGSERNATYEIPREFLNVANEAGEIKPIPLDYTAETSSKSAYLKGGYGNYSNPMVLAEISKTQKDDYTIGASGGFQSSKDGSIDDQRMRDAFVNVYGSKYLETAVFQAEAGFLTRNDWLYGYDHGLNTFGADSLEQSFNTFTANANLFNKEEHETGIDYNIGAGLNSTSDKIYDASEFGGNISAGFSTWVLDAAKAKLNVNARTRSTKELANTEESAGVVTAVPSVLFDVNDWEIDLGASFNYDKFHEFKIFPNVSIEKLLGDERFTFFAGWKGRTELFGLNEASSINPYIYDGITLENYTRQVRTPLGIKGKLSPSFAFKASVSQIVEDNKPLFVNRYSTIVPAVVVDARTYDIVVDDRVINWNFTGEVNYTFSDKATFLGGLKVNNYTTDTQAKAWHLPNLDLNSSFFFSPLEKLEINGGINVLSGIKFREQSGNHQTLDTSFNAQAGAKYMITDQIGVFVDANNLANQRYQRWKNYDSFGLNVLGGFVISY